MDAPQGPLPPPWIQAPPIGWLGLLGIKSGGRQPGHVVPDLMTVFEMSAFYRAGTRGVLAASTQGLNDNAKTPFGTVPQGKAWIIEDITAEPLGVLGGTANRSLAVGVMSPGGALVETIGPFSFVGLTGEYICASLGRPYIATPGSRVFCASVSPAATSADTFVLRCFGLEVSA